MCELLGMSSNLPATMNLSLTTLAEHGGSTGPHGDGWGVAYYEGADVRLIKDAEAAAGSDWVRFIRDHSLKSHLVVAHVRKATMGERALRNTQPFTRELAGRMHIFAHNGWLPGILDSPGFRSSRFHPVGETDSEQAFCALLDRMAEVWKRPADIPSLDARLAMVSSFAKEMRSLGPANFLYADGDALFAHGDRRSRAGTSVIAPPGLVSLQRRCRLGGRAFVTSGLSIDGGADQTVTLVASVPLTDEHWQQLEEGEVVGLCNGEIVARRTTSLVS
jgi:predicted glutamine amidotransferase